MSAHAADAQPQLASPATSGGINGPHNAQSSQIRLAVENRMMYDYTLVSAVARPDAIVPLTLKDGTTHFLLYSATNGPTIDRYYPDLSQPGGWSRDSVSFKAASIGKVVSGQDEHGAPLLFAITIETPSANSTASSVGMTLYQIPIHADGSMLFAQPLQSFNAASPRLSFDAGSQALFWNEDHNSINRNMTACLQLSNKAQKKYLISEGGHPVQFDFQTDPMVVPSSGDLAWPKLYIIGIADGAAYIGQTGPAEGAQLRVTQSWNRPIYVSGKKVSTVSLTALCYEDGTRRLVSSSGDGVVRKLDGRLDRSENMIWDSDWVPLDVTFPCQSARRVDVTFGNGTVTLALTDKVGRIWFAEQGAARDSWETPNLLDSDTTAAKSTGAQPLGVFFNSDEGNFSFAYVDSKNYLRIKIRDHDEGWQTTLVDAGLGTKSLAVPVYRVGIIVTDASDNDSPLPNVPIQLQTDAECYALVNGQLVYLSDLSSHTVSTDGHGCIWIMADIQNSLAVPVFTISSAEGSFPELTVARFDADAQAFTTSGTSEDALRDAKDKDGWSLFESSKCYDLATKLKLLGTVVDTIYEPRAYESPALQLVARPGLRAVMPGKERVLSEELNLSSIGNWQIIKDDNGLRFIDLTEDEAADVRVDLISKYAASRGIELDWANAAKRGILDFGWLTDSVEWFADHVIAAGTILLKKGKDLVSATISFVLEGVTYLFDATLDATSSIPIISDVVIAIMNFAGAVVGRVVEWVVRSIGWLADLGDVQRNRDKIRDDLKYALSNLHQRVENPQVLASKAGDQLRQWEETLHTQIVKFKASPTGKANNTQDGSSGDNIVTVLFSLAGGKGVAAETTWITEKLATAMSQIGPNLPRIPDFKVQDDLTSLAESIENITDNIKSLLDDVETSALQAFLYAISNFDKANVDPILDAIDRHLQDFLSNLASMTGDLGQIGDAMWGSTKQQLLLEWLDKEIDIPFFSALYKELAGQPFSVLDFTAYAAAIPYTILHSSSDRASKGARSRTAIEDSQMLEIFSLKVIKALVWTASCGLQEPSKLVLTPGVIAQLSERLNTSLDWTSSVLTIQYAHGKRAHWYKPAVADLSCVLVRNGLESGSANFPYRTLVNDLVRIFGAGLAGILDITDSAKDFSLTAFNSAVLSIVTAFGHLSVDQSVLSVEEPHVRAAYMVLQGLMMGGQAGIFLHDGLKIDEMKGTHAGGLDEQVEYLQVRIVDRAL